MSLIASKRESVGQSGYVHRSNFPADIEGIKVSNLSRFSALVLYPDGVTPSYAERYFGSNRQHYVIAPGGWLTMPVTPEPFALGADGILLGDNTLSSAEEMSSDIACIIEEYDSPQPYFSYRPSKLTIAQWEQKEVDTNDGWIAFKDLDPNYKMPQMRGGTLGLKIGNTGYPAGADGYARLEVLGRIGINAASEYEYLYIGCGGKKLYSGMILGTVFYQECFFNIANVERLGIMTSETGQRSYSGELYWVNGPIDRETFVPMTKSPSLPPPQGGELSRISTYHLVEIVVPWKQAGAGNGSITATHVAANGTAVLTETIVATGNGSGSATIYPKATFIDMVFTPGLNGTLTVDPMIRTRYRI